MKKITNLEDNTKKDSFLMLFIIYILHLVFMILISNLAFNYRIF